MKKNDIITDGTYYRLVLETLGDLVFLSGDWKEGETESSIKHNKEFASMPRHFKEISNWTVVVPEWNPREMLKFGNKYWFIDSTGEILEFDYCACETDKWRIATSNCFRSEADAIAYKKKVLGE